MALPDDPLATLAQLIVRLRSADASDRAALVPQLIPLLSDARVPLSVRLATAGRALEAIPDTPQAIQGVIRALTAGLSPARTLDRLRQLQHLTEKSDSLDALVTRREHKVKMSCPRCGVRLPRLEMAKHLWHEHGLTLVRGKTRSRAKAVEAIRREHAASGDPALLDRVVALAGEQAIRAWAAETATAEETIPLCAAARERGVGLCPGCFAEVSPAGPELPPPLALACGRLAGDGKVARARGVVRPRSSATLAALGVLVLFVFLAVAAPVRLPALAILATAFTIVAYVGVYLLSTSRGTPADRAIDAAWRKFARKLADRRDSARFLTRLCLTSVGRGDPFERANALNSIVARSREAPEECQLLAVALALQVDDGGRYGRDRGLAIAELVSAVFRGEQPPEFAEGVLAAYFQVPRDEGELARLRILLLEGAFASGLTAHDVLDLCSVSRNLGKAMQLPTHHLASLYGVWVHRNARPWISVGESRSVFELAREAPTTATRLLTRSPDLLLVCETHPEVLAELGPVLVCASGVLVGEVILTDPAAEVSIEVDGRELTFGKHRLKFQRAIPFQFASELKAWMRFRAEVLAAYPAIYLRGDSPLAAPLLSAFAVRCSACGTESLPAVGAVGRVLRT